jgi:AmmeMemoRadiSam system protein B
MDPRFRPRLRPLEAVTQIVKGRPLVVLRDPEGVSDAVAAIPPDFARILIDALDGSRTLAELEEVFDPRADIAGVVGRLDEALFLESPRYRARKDELLAEYRAAPARPSITAGQWPEDLPAFLDGLYSGLPPSRARSPLRAVAIPHLDLRYGGRTAARALEGLGDRFTGDTVVILGVGHQLAHLPYALTRKAFETPLGTVPIAEDLYDRVIAKAGTWLEEEELIHRREHSVEYAALLLRHALPGRDFRILPVLCGSFCPMIAEGREPATVPLVGAFIETLLEEVGEALLLASVDLAHLGPAYGDPEPLTEADLAAAGAADLAMLDAATSRDASGFFQSLVECEDRRRVCGSSALYTLLALLPPGPKGRLLAYEQPVFPEPGNTVTICAVHWTERRRGPGLRGPDSGGGR